MTKSLHRYCRIQGHEHPKRWVFRWLQKTGRDGAYLTWHIRATCNSEDTLMNCVEKINDLLFC